jgi:hypothetical protein
MTYLENILWLTRFAVFASAGTIAVGVPGLTGQRIGPLRRLRRVVNSARGSHQEQEQRAFALVLCFQATALPATHDDLAGGVVDPPLPSRSAAFAEDHFEHQQ